MSDRVALYFPYIEPPDSWIKQSLLIADSISSILPESIERLPPALEWLQDEGLYMPALVRDGLGSEYFADVEDALLAFAYVPEYMFDGHTPPEPDSLVDVNFGKLTPEVEKLLLALRLAEPKGDRGALSVHRNVAEVLLAVTARHYAACRSTSDTLVTPSTDAPSSMEHAFDLAKDGAAAHLCEQIVMEDVLPIPGEDCSLADVVDFRRRHEDELLQFRVAIKELVRDVSANTDTDEVIRAVSDKVDVAMRQLRSAGDRKGFRLLRGAGVILLVGAATSVGADPSTFENLVVGAAGSGGISFAKRLVRGKPENHPLAYAFKAGHAFGY